ncbi:MAG: cobalt-precorrin-5B (C(1))-methyltransferase CbiD [Lachnospiraceae bacterium]|nr:cobalt-precorrin-5B (C(1))-methyltransferase CbiD [Lachnospiraceae bacterium]
MRYGFTTGSCATAAAKAAAYMLLTGIVKENISIETPKKITYNATILDIKIQENKVSCAVKKDDSDDPDVTKGALIYAEVSYGENYGDTQSIYITGGKGVGLVTKPGLDQPVGNHAINKVPREMITKEVLEVCNLADYSGSLNVVISVPEGEEIAKKTFNPRLGIEGGISILGTSGIVEPMSNKAVIETIKVELNQRRELGYDYVAIAPGNYGLDFMKKTYGYDLEKSIKCSNFIGETIDMAKKLGFKKVLFTGHIGKLIKVAGGIMNTHSREADCRMEIITASAICCNIDAENARRIMACNTTEEAIGVLNEAGLKDKVMNYVMDKIIYYMNKRAASEEMKIDCILYSNEYGELAKSKEAESWFILLEQEQEQKIL